VRAEDLAKTKKKTLLAFSATSPSEFAGQSETNAIFELICYALVAGRKLTASKERNESECLILNVLPHWI
jgi:hypothetical protein